MTESWDMPFQPSPSDPAPAPAPEPSPPVPVSTDPVAPASPVVPSGEHSFVSQDIVDGLEKLGLEERARFDDFVRYVERAIAEGNFDVEVHIHGAGAVASAAAAAGPVQTPTAA